MQYTKIVRIAYFRRLDSIVTYKTLIEIITNIFRKRPAKIHKDFTVSYKDKGK